VWGGVFLGGLFLVGIIFFYIFMNPLKDTGPGYLLRYPFVSYWFAAFLPEIATLFANPYYEILYRIIPLVFACAIARLFQSKLSSNDTYINLIWGGVVAVIPVLFYYSSMQYLEMPVIFLMTIVCFEIKSLVYDDLSQLKHNPSWYALVLIGFIKETTLPFLACYLVVRWMMQFVRYYKDRGRNWQNSDNGNAAGNWLRSLVLQLSKEFSIAFSVLFPIFLYLFFRSNFVSTRSYNFHLANLLEPRVYSTFMISLIDQFGLFLLGFFIGMVFLLYKREYVKPFFLSAIFLGYFVFFTVDEWTYIGYSRFNLYVLPPVLVASCALLSPLIKRSRAVSIGLASTAIVAGLLLSPMNWDGTKKSLWDSYYSDNSEKYYPYREAIAWLKDNHPDQRVLFANLSSHYPYFFYFEKYNWHPGFEDLPYQDYQNDTQALEAALTIAEDRSQSLVLYLVMGNSIPKLNHSFDYKLEKVIKNDAHILTIYSKVDSSLPNPSP